MTRRRVLITGRGVVSPMGIGIGPHAAALAAGRTAIGPVAPLVALGLPASRGAVVTAEALAPHAARLPRKQQKLYNRPTALAIVAASLAMEEAALAGAIAPARLGVLLGVNALWWDLHAMAEYLAASGSAAGPLDMALANAFCMRNINPLDYSLKRLPNLAAGHLAIQHNAQGLCRAVIDGAIGAGHAVAQAAHSIAEGHLDAAVCGGVDAQVDALHYASASGMGLLASDDGASPGQIYGEGAGVLVLEAEDHARARGAAVYGRVLAFEAAAGDGRITPDQDVASLTARLTRVLERTVTAAGMPDVLVLHADGTAVNDAAEDAAVIRVFGEGPAPRRVRAKAAHGHLGAAALPVELLGAAAAPGHRRLLGVALGNFGECAALALATGEEAA